MKLILFAQLSLLLGGAPPATVQQLLDAHDRAFAERHHPDEREAARRLLARAATRDPQACDVAWRQAREAVWDAEGIEAPSSKTRLAARARTLGEQSVRLCSDRAEAHYYAALGIGLYAGSTGMLRAFAEGLEAQFRQRLGEAERLQEAVANGNLHAAWGSFYLRLPWPKRDLRLAARHARRALELNPLNLRARLVLAEVSWADGKNNDAIAILREIAAASPGRYSAPEELRVKHLAVLRLQEWSRE